MKDIYFKVKQEHHNYKGIRYFRFNAESEKVIQICASPGAEKKGRTNSFGVYLIHRITFLSNYFTIGYVESCTKREYEKNFDKVIKMLK